MRVSHTWLPIACQPVNGGLRLPFKPRIGARKLVRYPGAMRATAAPPKKLDGACHCGAVRFRVALSDGLRTARRCTCSLCRMRGAVAVSAALGDLRVVAGADMLATYRFNTGTARHHFCRRCGVYTHHQRRSNPDEYGVNLACLEGMSPFDLPEVPVLDGENHPADTGRLRRVGTLKFVSAPEA